MRQSISTALIAGLLSLAGPHAQAELGAGADGSLDQRIDEIAKLPDALATAGAALAHARRALGQARELEQTGQPDAAVRARSIARAAVVLAERRLALARERSELRASERRLAGARERAQQTLRALEHAVARHERVVSGQELEPGAEPSPDPGSSPDPGEEDAP